MGRQHQKPDPHNTRTQPDVPYHMAQSLAALGHVSDQASLMQAAQVHATLAVADAIERQTKILAGLLDPSRGEP